MREAAAEAFWVPGQPRPGPGSSIEGDVCVWRVGSSDLGSTR